MSTPRLRIFAGPNGSGKSTLKTLLKPELIVSYINADELEVEIAKSGSIDLVAFDLSVTPEEVSRYLGASSLLAQSGWRPDQITVSRNRLVFSGGPLNSYLASVVAEFLRNRLIAAKRSFTFETVMSHRSKLELLRQAQLSGHRTYLYFVATDDPKINVSRVNLRVRAGGHTVPEDKIISRYHASLRLLPEAISLSDRAYIFDNSVDGREYVWIAEFTSGTAVELKVETVPSWFSRALGDRMTWSR